MTDEFDTTIRNQDGEAVAIVTATSLGTEQGEQVLARIEEAVAEIEYRAQNDRLEAPDA